MNSFIIVVVFLACVASILPESAEAYTAGTGRFGDESKVGILEVLRNTRAFKPNQPIKRPKKLLCF